MSWSSRIGLFVILLAVAHAMLGCAAPSVLRDPNVLRVGVTADSPPIVYRQGGKVVGFEAEFARLLADELGKKVRFVEVGWRQQVPALLDGRTDIIMSGMSYSADRAERVAFATPYVASGQQALTREAMRLRFNSIHTITTTDRRIGVVRGTTGAGYARSNLARARVKSYSTLRTAVRGLLDGDVDAVIYDGPTLQWTARQYPGRGLYLSPAVLTEERYAWAVRPDDTALRARLSELVARWQEDGTIDRVLREAIESVP